VGYRKPPAPPPPGGLSAALQNDWIQAWRRVRVQPQVDVPAWDGSGKVRVTPSVKHVGLWAATWATWETGADVRPGVDILAEVSGYSTRAVGIALDAVCRLGFMWQYVDGSQSGRPGRGRKPVKSEYRLTVPDDILSGRVPLLDGDYCAPGEDPNSDQAMSDQLISEPGSPELSDRITRTQFAPPIQDPDTHPDITVVSVSATSVEGKRAGRDQPNSDQVMSSRAIASPLMAAVPTPEGSRCAYDGCRVSAAPVADDGYHESCRYLADVKARAAPPTVQAREHPEAS
jgi:hypothetical protein